jgi:hypothetical protein
LDVAVDEVELGSFFIENFADEDGCTAMRHGTPAFHSVSRRDARGLIWTKQEML